MTGKQAHTRGFTLIELLVTIAIVSILSSTVLASLNEARAKARDARRVADLQQIALALELYYDDHGDYPRLDGPVGVRPGTNWAYSKPDGLDRWAILETQLAGYIPELPRDPINNSAYPDSLSNENYSYGYKYNWERGAYALVARLETDHPLRCHVKGWHHRTDFFSNGNLAFCNGTHGGAVLPFPLSPYLYDGSSTRRSSN